MTVPIRFNRAPQQQDQDLAVDPVGKWLYEVIRSMKAWWSSPSLEEQQRDTEDRPDLYAPMESCPDLPPVQLLLDALEAMRDSRALPGRRRTDSLSLGPVEYSVMLALLVTHAVVVRGTMPDLGWWTLMLCTVHFLWLAVRWGIKTWKISGAIHYDASPLTPDQSRAFGSYTGEFLCLAFIFLSICTSYSIISFVFIFTSVVTVGIHRALYGPPPRHPKADLNAEVAKAHRLADVTQRHWRACAGKTHPKETLYFSRAFNVYAWAPHADMEWVVDWRDIVYQCLDSARTFRNAMASFSNVQPKTVSVTSKPFARGIRFAVTVGVTLVDDVDWRLQASIRMADASSSSSSSDTPDTVPDVSSSSATDMMTDVYRDISQASAQLQTPIPLTGCKDMEDVIEKTKHVTLMLCSKPECGGNDGIIQPYRDSKGNIMMPSTERISVCKKCGAYGYPTTQ